MSNLICEFGVEIFRRQIWQRPYTWPNYKFYKNSNRILIAKKPTPNSGKGQLHPQNSIKALIMAFDVIQLSLN